MRARSRERATGACTAVLPIGPLDNSGTAVPTQLDPFDQPKTSNVNQEGNVRAPICCTRFSRALLLVLCISFAPACATYNIYQVGGPREMGNQPLTEWKTKTLHSLAWGAVRQDLPIDNCKLGNGTRTNIEEVRVQANVGSLAATILTLGFWRPLKVSWRCAKPPGIGGTVGSAQ